MDNIALELISQLLEQYTFEIDVNKIVTFRTHNYVKLAKPYDDVMTINNNFYSLNPINPIPMKTQLDKFCEFVFGYIFVRIRKLLTNPVVDAITNKDVLNIFVLEYDKTNIFSFGDSEYWKKVYVDMNGDTFKLMCFIKKLYDGFCTEIIRLCKQN